MTARDDINFITLLQSLRRGELLRRADSELEKVTAAMKDTGGDGEIIIRLPFKLNKAGQVECQPKLSSKIPQHAIGTGIFFLGDEGELTRRDPNQMDIEDEIDRRRRAEAGE